MVLCRLSFLQAHTVLIRKKFFEGKRMGIETRKAIFITCYVLYAVAVLHHTSLSMGGGRRIPRMFGKRHVLIVCSKPNRTHCC